MKKVAVYAIIFLFSVNVLSAFSGGMPESMEDTSGKGVFQKMADNIDTWDDTSQEAKGKSLRGNKKELKRRRGIKSKRNIIGV